jgi:predicted dehydrogenase
VLVGVGLHAEHSYLPALRNLLADGAVRLLAVVDVAERRAQVVETLSRCGVRPDHIITDDADAAAARGQARGLARLARLTERERIDGMIVSTDPRSHRGVLEWAASRGIDVLVDKPVTAREMRFTDESAAELANDFRVLNKAFAGGGSAATVMVPRRLHPGYVFIREILREAVEQLGLPVTYLDLYHSSGYWNLPDEFLTRENHPYKYGYGALLHSGYHFIDLACWLLKVNEALQADWADRLDVVTQHANPDDVLEQEPHEFYRRVGLAAGLKEAYSRQNRALARGYGETDAHVGFRALRGQRAITLGSIRMVETGVSGRTWRDLPQDTYKGNGKFSQDRLTAHVGHVLSVHAWERHSEQADTAGASPKEFVVEVLRNHRLIGGSRVEQRVFGQEHAAGEHVSLSVLGKRELFARWLEGRTDGLTLDTHDLTVGLLTAAYTAMFRARRCLPPVAGADIIAEKARRI